MDRKINLAELTIASMIVGLSIAGLILLVIFAVK